MKYQKGYRWGLSWGSLLYKLRGGIKLYVKRDQEYITGLMRNKLRVGGEGLRYKTGMCLTLQAKIPRKNSLRVRGPRTHWQDGERLKGSP